jgi:hypothetical protein
MSLAINNNKLYSSSTTLSSGTTATGAITLSLTMTALQTTSTHELIVSNNGPYDATVSLYKEHAIGTGTYTGDMGTAFLVPAVFTSGNVTVSAKNIQIQGLFSSDPPTLRITYTATLTAAVTNLVYIKELDV